MSDGEQGTGGRNRAGVDSVSQNSDVTWLGQLTEEPVEAEAGPNWGHNGTQHNPHRVVALGWGRLARKSVMIVLWNCSGVRYTLGNFGAGPLA